MPNGDDADRLIAELRDRLQAKERELDGLRADVQDAQLTGIAVGLLLARSPGWTEQDALAAWDRACARFTRGGDTRALASYVVQTGTLPGDTPAGLV